ncbi:DUF6891 domain-containing protein [Nonomuraea cavernae]|uniref:DUF6891 domain-containing protein n=1 Tax=Nonomuraea cavernae TaxID=2045107 RepID=UPI0033C751B1
MIEPTVLEELSEDLRTQVAVGRSAYSWLVEDAMERWADEVEDDQLLESTIREIATQELARHLAEQAAWPESTDCDRLSLAMIDLTQAGIVSRENYTCCRNCGLHDIQAEVQRIPAARGYTFYHQQDAERAAQGEGIYLAFGSTGAAGTESVGQEIMTALGRRGLSVRWNGAAGQRIQVPLIWRRRRFGPLARHPEANRPAADLRVTYCDYSALQQHEPVPMSLQECRDLLLWLTPSTRNFTSFQNAAGAILQFQWESDLQLWAESPDAAAQCSRGRHVTIDEALMLVTTLVHDDRIALTDLGPLHTVSWT